jgi:hypothetical protein
MNERDLCANCFEGHLVRTIGPGRTVPDVRGPFEVPESFELLTCDQCGEIWLDLTQAKALGALKSGVRRPAVWHQTVQANVAADLYVRVMVGATSVPEGAKVTPNMLPRAQLPRSSDAKPSSLAAPPR